MKKLNQKGFAIASILYSIMVLFLMLLLGILGILGSRKATLDKNKKDIINSLNHAYLVDKFIFEHRNITIVNNGNKDDIAFALMDGVKAIDKDGNEMGKEFIKYDLDINNIENRDYNVTYTANNGGKTIVGTRIITFTSETNIKTFSYTGASQTFTPSQNGSYKIELWGASGGDSYGTYKGGKGGYTSGIIKLNEGTNLYTYVGGKGVTNGGAITSDNYINTIYASAIGGYNGGGYSGNQSIYNGSGGGATDIRLVNGVWNNFESLKSRIMVSGAGGGASFYTITNNYYGTGGSGGGLNGYDGQGPIRTYPRYGTGGSQNAPGAGDDILFGYGGSSNNSPSAARVDGGGGSGYYGGSAGKDFGAAGGGGSSFISGYDGCDAISEESVSNNIIHTGQPNHYSGYIFSNSKMLSGNDLMPTYDGTSTMVGNSGNGYAKISLIYYY